MIPRNATSRVKDLLRYFPALVLTGARQTGKTTLLREALPGWNYVSLDLPSTAALAEDSPREFFARNPPPCVIDEVQYAPGLFRHLKTRIDADRHAMGSWVLTGSQKFTLMKEVSDSLAGRAAILELEGLSREELLGTQEAGASGIEGLMLRGGFPELWRVPDLPAADFFSSYLATYLERDVRQILNVGNLRDFERFIRVLAARNAGELDLSATGTAVGVTAKTATAWLSVLEASNLVALLEPWHGNVGKRIVKRPKVYFRDTGLLAWLLGLSGPLDATSPYIGAFWETLVFSELRKSIAASGKNRQLYYYRDNRGTEVDFLALGEGCRLIEAKWTEGPTRGDCVGMEKLAASAREAAAAEFAGARGYVLCRTPEPWPLGSPSLPCEGRGLEDVGKILGD